jgi:hypothetical protein
MAAATRIRMSLDGGADMKKRLEDLARGFPRETRRAVVAVGERLLALTRDRVPVKTGALRDSGRISVQVRQAGGAPNILLTLAYGGPDARHAVRVHEDLEQQHRSGQAKFAESVLREGQGTIGADIAGEISLPAAGS